MLAVHWTPVNNTKLILKNGIKKTKNGLFCFPLTGHRSLDRWWLYFFNQCGVRPKKRYNGIVFRIAEEDMPAYFGAWFGATTRSDFKKEIASVKQLGKEFRNIISWRLGEIAAHEQKLDMNVHDWEKTNQLYTELGEKEMGRDPKAFVNKMNSLDFMGYTFEDYQIVLSHSIPSKRIIKILPQGNEFGKVIRNRKRNKWDGNMD